MSEGVQVTVRIVVLVVMLISWFGLVIPGVPGLTIIWLAGLGYGIANGFTWGSGLLFAGITVLMLLGNVSDNLLMGAGAKKKGASWWSLGAALLGGVVGTLLLPPLGGIPIALVALFGVEWLRLKDWRAALDSTKGMAVGFGWSFVVRFGIGAVMIGLWAIWAFVLKP